MGIKWPKRPSEALGVIIGQRRKKLLTAWSKMPDQVQAQGMRRIVEGQVSEGLLTQGFPVPSEILLARYPEPTCASREDYFTLLEIERLQEIRYDLEKNGL